MYILGALIVLAITIFNVIMLRRQTPVLILSTQLLISIIVASIGWEIVLLAIACYIGIIFLLYRRFFQSEDSNYEYNRFILSISAIFNLAKEKKDNEITIGRVMPVNKHEIKHNMRPISLSNTILSGATLITGATGSGKTTTLLSIMKQKISERKPVIFFDYKGEADILDKLEEFAKLNDLDYFECSARKCTFSYDPLINLNNAGKVEAIMNSRRWDAGGADEHYRTAAQLLIQRVIDSYDEYRISNNDNSNYLVGLDKFLKQYKPQQNERDGFITLHKQIEILLSSRANLLFMDNMEKFSFDRERPYIVCFSFISANKSLANSLSSFIFQDIMDTGTKKRFSPEVLLCIDEFGTLESSTLIKDILEKGRSGGCQTVFSILDINQIAMTAGEYFVNAILGTINSFIIHAGATQKTADLLAGVQKYENKGYSIMDLRKPYKNNPPTALFISKYPILSKNGNQEVYKIIPYIYKDTNKKINYNYEVKEEEKSTYVDIKLEPTMEDTIEEDYGIDDEEVEFDVEDFEDFF